MYKQIRIVYTESAGQEILKILDEFGIEKYINMQRIQTKWGKDVRHLGTHIWPGTDCLMTLFLKNDIAEKLVEELKNLKPKLKQGIDMHVLISPIEDII